MLPALGYLAIYLLFIGMGAGWLAWIILGKNRVLKRADRKPNWAALLGLGVAGSFVGGLGMSLLSGGGFDVRPAGLLVSVVGSLLTVSIYIWTQTRSA